MKSHFDRLYKMIMEEVEDYNFSDEQKQVVLNVMKTLLDEKDFNDWKDYIDQICEEMYNNHHYMKYQIEHLDKRALRAILDDVEQGWLDPHEQYVPEYEESVKADKSRRIIKEQMEEGYWEKVDQYKKDIQAYLDKGDGEEYDGFEGYVDDEDFYTTIEEIAAQNKDKIPALENELLSYIESCPGGDSGNSMDGSLGLYQDIMEGNEGYAESNIFYGLTDPETWTNLGFNVGEELAVLLKQHFVDVAYGPDGSFWEGYSNDGADGSAQCTLNNIGLNKVVEAIENIRSSEYDDDDQDYDDQDDDWVPEDAPSGEHVKVESNFVEKHPEWISYTVQNYADQYDIAYTVSLLDSVEEALKQAIAQGTINTEDEVDKWIGNFIKNK